MFHAHVSMCMPTCSYKWRCLQTWEGQNTASGVCLLIPLCLAPDVLFVSLNANLAGPSLLGILLTHFLSCHGSSGTTEVHYASGSIYVLARRRKIYKNGKCKPSLLPVVGRPWCNREPNT